MKKTTPAFALVAAGPSLLNANGLFRQIINFSHEPNEFELVIRNAKSYINGKWDTFQIGIRSDGTLKISSEVLKGRLWYDGTGKVLSPGFIDILADNSSDPRRTYKIFEEYKLTDGVTTALQMHGGHHDARWYYETFGELPHYINYGISTKVMNIRRRNNLLRDRYKAVGKNLDEGALGVSHSIEYQPTPYNELLEYAKLAAEYKRPYFLHLRYSSEQKELEGVKEAVDLARDSGAHVHIDHLNSTGGTFHMEEALEIIQGGIDEGLNLTTCVYPYSYWATYLHSKRFDEGWKERYGISYEDLTVVGTGEKLNRTSFEKYRKIPGVLVAVPEGVMPLDKTVELALKKDFCMIGSDGGIERSAKANNHPRGAGCFATAIRYGLSIGFSLEKVLEKVTLLPRNLILPAMDKRGILKDGFIADLVLFDPDTINGTASPANPNSYSDGIEAVFVNGKIAFSKGRLLDTAGEAIRYQTV